MDDTIRVVRQHYSCREDRHRRDMARSDKIERGERLRAARKDAGLTVEQVARRVGYSASGVRAIENGQNGLQPDAAELFAPVVRASPAWLLTGESGPAPTLALTRIIGLAGADTEGVVQMATGHDSYGFAPIPPGGSAASVALEVKGHSMRALADDGALIYFENQRTPPTEDMIGSVVIVETEDDFVLVKRLLRGSGRGLYDLESVSGPILKDMRIRWAAEITAIIPPRQARRVIRRHGEAA